MGEKLTRTQVLLAERQRAALTDIAERSGRSVSEVVRDVVDRYLAEQDKEELDRFLRALDRIRKHGEDYLAAGGKPLDVDMAEMINEMREERDAEIVANLHEHRD